MSRPKKSQPAPPVSAEDPVVEEPAPETDEANAPEETAEPEVPLNRAERRAKAKGTDPSHVGPRAGRSSQGRTARSHTKRQLS